MIINATLKKIGVNGLVTPGELSEAAVEDMLAHFGRGRGEGPWNIQPTHVIVDDNWLAWHDRQA